MILCPILTFKTITRDKYFNHKKPQRPDVTKISSSSSSFEEPLAKVSIQ